VRKIFVPQKDEKTGSGDREDFIVRSIVDLYSLPNIIRVIKSRRMSWAGHVELVGTGEVHAGFWWDGLMERTIWKT
jgi:hypothetical protein